MTTLIGYTGVLLMPPAPFSAFLERTSMLMPWSPLNPFPADEVGSGRFLREFTLGPEL